MATAASRRVSTGVAWAAFGVLAWATLTILTSGSAAHADDGSDSILDGVTSAVSSTVSGTTELVTDVADDVVTPLVTEVVAPVVQEAVPAVVEKVAPIVTSTPVVGDAVEPVLAPVAEAAGEAVPAVTAPVTDLLQDAPVSQITSPVLDIVADVPLVGEVLDDLGVTVAVTEVVDVVDTTSGLLGNTVEGSTPPILDAVVPPADIPTAPNEPVAPAPSTSAEAPMADEATVLRTGTVMAASASTAHTERSFIPPIGARSTFTTSADATGVPSLLPKAAHAPPGSPAPSSSAGHGGGSIGEAARLTDDNADSLRAWKRIFAAPDDDLPSSPVAETDISPD